MCRIITFLFTFHFHLLFPAACPFLIIFLIFYLLRNTGTYSILSNVEARGADHVMRNSVQRRMLKAEE